MGLVLDRAIILLAARHPIKAKPAKAGDAKPWVYRHNDDHDCQVAEDHEMGFM